MSIIFIDPNFKLACLDILFDLGYFEEELANALSVNVDADEYEINTERLQYFLQLPITQEQLDEIKSLAPDGGDDIYFHVFPQWSGEEEDLYIKNFDDLKLLRNLKDLHVYAVAEEASLNLRSLINLQHLKTVNVCKFYLASESADLEKDILIKRGIKLDIQ